MRVERWHTRMTLRRLSPRGNRRPVAGGALRRAPPATGLGY
jgi:hypothetical protein